MAIPTILDYYNYSIFSTAAYVRMGIKSLDGSTFAAEASSTSQQRLPLSLATALFNPSDANAPRWNIRRYFRNDISLSSGKDPIAALDRSGFGAILFEQSANGEKVLAVTGTESDSLGENSRMLLAQTWGKLVFWVLRSRK